MIFVSSQSRGDDRWGQSRGMTDWLSDEKPGNKIIAHITKLMALVGYFMAREKDAKSFTNIV